MNKPHPHADLLRAISCGDQMEIYDSRTRCWVTDTGDAALRAITVNPGHVRIHGAKREARRWWLVTNGDPTGVIYPQNDRESAAICAIRNHGVVIPVREVLPDEQ